MVVTLTLCIWLLIVIYMCTDPDGRYKRKLQRDWVKQDTKPLQVGEYADLKERGTVENVKVALGA